MPGGGFFTQDLIRAAIANGTLTVANVDAMATRVLTAMYTMGVMDTAQPTGNAGNNGTSEAHAALAQTLAENAAVLIKNEGNLLPLGLGLLERRDTESDPSRHTGVAASAAAKPLRKLKIALVGAAAACKEPTPTFGFGWPPTVGCLNSGGGSGGVVAAGVVSILDALLADTRAEVSFANGSDTAAAAALAAAADVSIVVVGSTSSEGTDRSNTSLPGTHLAFLKAVAAASPQKKTVVLLMTPGAVTMDWAGNVSAILSFFLPGQAQGAAAVNVLFGNATPFGRLPVSMPATENEVGLSLPQYPGVAYSSGLQTAYSERLEVGYRWYHSHGVKPAYCFGHGLSYTTFHYSALQLAPSGATLTLENTGTVAGAEVVQLYLTYPAAAREPPVQLKGFKKVVLAAGAAMQVEIPLTKREFAVWDAGLRGWKVVGGTFQIDVGASSCDLRVSSTLDVESYGY